MKLIITDWSDPTSLREVPDQEAKLYSSGFVFDLEWKEQILNVAIERQRLKKAYEDSMSLVYELINKRAREGFKQA